MTRASAKKAPAEKTVLVLDDSPIVLETLAAALGTRFQVRTAENLDQLEKELAAFKPDLFVLDVQMPEAFGDDVAGVLRIVRKLKAPMILFSSLDEQSLAARAAEAGVEGYVSKDAGVPALVERVVQLIGAPAKPGK